MQRSKRGRTFYLCFLGAALWAVASSAQEGSDMKAAEFVDLLAGPLEAHWRGYRQDDVPAGWKLEDGELTFRAVEGGRGDLITNQTYEDFELRLEWRVGPAGNSGIFFRVSEDQPATYNTGAEMQILDNDGHVDGRNPLTSAGSNYALHAPPRDVTRPVGEYNEVVLRVDGPRVRHWLNGELVVDYELWTDDWQALVDGSKFRAMPGYARNRVGHIALQDHGDPVAFRNIQIRRLGD